MENKVDNARVVPAPLILLVLLILGYLLGWVVPARFLPGNEAQVVGVVLVVAAFLIGGSALQAMRKAHTSPNPRKPTTALVESGLFRYSRNPMYVSLFILYLGVVVYANLGWSLVLFPVVFLLVDRFAVKREEIYLERTFGDDFRRYKSRVRRWI